MVKKLLADGTVLVKGLRVKKVLNSMLKNKGNEYFSWKMEYEK